ncbi:hypothetical protein RIF29_28977 [Crotalaria pallida]|uniref:FAR1 domain-containing protein n=1 Tax=Crotalaria pallida TaxID=3830 RepID=A0AAN9HVU2_CROPI
MNPKPLPRTTSLVLPKSWSSDREGLIQQYNISICISTFAFAVVWSYCGMEAENPNVNDTSIVTNPDDGNCKANHMEDNRDGTEEDDFTFIKGVEELGKISFTTLTEEQVMMFKFADLEVAYQFYNEYVKSRRFGVRKEKGGKIKGSNDISWKLFVCSREGKRDKKYDNLDARKRLPRAKTRCGCLAQFRVYVDSNTGGRKVVKFYDKHTHPVLDRKFDGMLPSHCRMTEVDKGQMINMKKVGITIPKMFRSFVRQSGGPQFVRFRKKQLFFIRCEGKETAMLMQH